MYVDVGNGWNFTQYTKTALHLVATGVNMNNRHNFDQP